ncbi:helix-turn-helix domain-containing protein [Pseudoglutamicibacter cumminsii]|uniref:IclR family transcriptional regulator n=1 Tax=Pseudoglutamicibacter cumminsii TaxID=156979 RepID=UPI0025543657|nr:helix-turn-helix domain-containing protein [Pseudoglutamicibacter cumminsii]MDK7083955.1 helix-turn-helix domain-containing protein [Pseudoglutamicibacter cumminsii]
MTVETEGRAGASAAGSQTLSRGLSLLEAIAEHEQGLTIPQLCDRVGLHRSIVYRLLRTLEAHNMVVRGPDGVVTLGPNLLVLARSVNRDVQASALPELTRLSQDLGMTAFIAVLTQNHVVTLVSVEPKTDGAALVQRPGSSHALDAGAPGAAIRAQLGPAELEARGVAAPELFGDAARPYAKSCSQVLDGVSSIAVPLRVPGYAAASLGVVFVSRENDAGVAAALHRSASLIEADLL